MVAVPQLGFGPDETGALLPLESRDPSGGPLHPDRGFRFRRTIAASGAFSLTLHALAAFAILATWQKNELGVGQQTTEAIAVEFVASPTLEQALVEIKETPAGSISSVAQEVGSDSDAEARSEAEAKPDTQVADTPVSETVPTLAPPPVETMAGPTETVMAGTLEAEDSLPPPAQAKKTTETTPPKRLERETEKPKKQTEKTAEAHTPKKTDDADARAKKKGGAAARSSSAAPPGASRAAASRGDVAGYAARVRSRVIGNKPAGRGLRGVATVRFTVSPSGGLSGVRLVRSSGNASLDQAALGAVRRAAPFPVPPPGVWSSSLAFTVPLTFQ